MCFGIPMQVTQIEGFTARCEAKGITREASLFMLQHEDIQVGDFIVVHLGQAIDRVTPEQAEAAWAIYDEMLAAEASAGAS